MRSVFVASPRGVGSRSRRGPSWGKGPRPPLLLLATELYGSSGGVQTYMRGLLEILSLYGEARERKVHCLSLCDAKDLSPRSSIRVGPQGDFSGCGRSKMQFIRRAFHWGLRHPGSIWVVGHIHLSPLAWQMARLRRVSSYLVVLHGIEAWRKVNWLRGSACRNARCLVATTAHTTRRFQRCNPIPGERMRIIPLALGDAQIEEPGWENGNGRKDWLDVLTVSRLSSSDRYKGIDRLIEAVHRAGLRDAAVRLTLVGEGDDIPRLQALAGRLGVQDQVRFLGRVSEDRLAGLYGETDVFAMPSHGEGFGIVYLEAMRYGKPCIGGARGGAPEVIRHGVDGYLVDQENVERITDYLASLFRDPALREAMGRKGFQKVRSRFLFPRWRDDWFALLDELDCG